VTGDPRRAALATAAPPEAPTPPRDQPARPPGPGGQPPRPPRRWPDPFIAAVLGVGVGLLLVWLHHPRMGLYGIAAVLAALAGARLVLPARRAGLLVVRGRSFDVAVLAGLAVGLFLVASVTHFPVPAS
jgi:hypothetical protein